MFEENLFVLQQEFWHDSLSRVILETFLELVNQTSYNLFRVTNHHAVKASIKPFVHQICHFLAL